MGVNNQEVSISSYEMIVPSFIPPDAPFAPLSANPVYVGGRDANGEALGVCISWFDNGAHPGKYRMSANTCNFGYAGIEQADPVGFSMLRGF